MWQTEIPSSLSMQAAVWVLEEGNEVLGVCQLSGISGYHSQGWGEINALKTPEGEGGLPQTKGLDP